MRRGETAVGVVTTPSDRTEHLRAAAEHESLEAQLRQAQKMEAVGQLAGGVAHDFNNILTAIIGNASLMQASRHLTEDQVHDAGKRAAAITKHLLTFSRRQRFECSEVDMNAVVLGVRSMLRRLLGETIDFKVAVAGQPLVVWADSGMLEQVLVNLGVNARDAMARGGQFTISTSAVVIPAGVALSHPQATPGPGVRLMAADSGCGTPAENLSRIFEPFFSTRKVGKGTGLGLSIVHGIVEQQGGWIEVESRVGLGTTFHMYFPRIPGSRAQASAPGTAVAAPPRGSESILLTENDEGVRKLAKRALERADYHVFEAEDGPTALEVWEHQRSEIRRVLMDMVMPGGLSGPVLANEFRRLSADLPLVFCSGYSEEILEQEALPNHRSAFLARPYELSRLLTVVRELLDAW